MVGFVSFRVNEAGLPLFFLAVSKRYYDTHLLSVFQRNWIKGWRWRRHDVFTPVNPKSQTNCAKIAKSGSKIFFWFKINVATFEWFHHTQIVAEYTDMCQKGQKCPVLYRPNEPGLPHFFLLYLVYFDDIFNIFRKEKNCSPPPGIRERP